MGLFLFISITLNKSRFFIGGVTSTNYRLTHKLVTGIGEASQGQRYEPPAPATHAPRPSSNFNSAPASRPSYNSGSSQSSSLSQLPDSSICGVPISSVGLVKGGSEYRRGDWPWLGAFMHKGKFSCGGSLSNDYIFFNIHDINKFYPL